MSPNVTKDVTEAQDETSLKRVLKQVLKQAEYNKLMPVIDFLDSNDSISVQDVINITGKSRTTIWRYLNILVEAEEGCLSLLGTRNTTRYKEIEVEYEDINYKKQRQKFIGFTAQIIQHEMDHL